MQLPSSFAHCLQCRVCRQKIEICTTLACCRSNPKNPAKLTIQTPINSTSEPKKFNWQPKSPAILSQILPNSSNPSRNSSFSSKNQTQNPQKFQTHSKPQNPSNFRPQSNKFDSQNPTNSINN